MRKLIKNYFDIGYLKVVTFYGALRFSYALRFGNQAVPEENYKLDSNLQISLNQASIERLVSNPYNNQIISNNSNDQVENSVNNNKVKLHSNLKVFGGAQNDDSNQNQKRKIIFFGRFQGVRRVRQLQAKFVEPPARIPLTRPLLRIDLKNKKLETFFQRSKSETTTKFKFKPVHCQKRSQYQTLEKLLQKIENQKEQSEKAQFKKPKYYRAILSGRFVYMLPDVIIIERVDEPFLKFQVSDEYIFKPQLQKHKSSSRYQEWSKFLAEEEQLRTSVSPIEKATICALISKQVNVNQISTDSKPLKSKNQVTDFNKLFEKLKKQQELKVDSNRFAPGSITDQSKMDISLSEQNWSLMNARIAIYRYYRNM